MGIRFILNDFIAFKEFATVGQQIDHRSATIATYALCGFANLTSVAVQVGAIGALAPSRRPDLARLGFKALFAATLTNWMAASLVSLFL
jgi:CNT family concentrative nucleoside transporter